MHILCLWRWSRRQRQNENEQDGRWPATSGRMRRTVQIKAKARSDHEKNRVSRVFFKFFFKNTPKRMFQCEQSQRITHTQCLAFVFSYSRDKYAHNIAIVSAFRGIYFVRSCCSCSHSKWTITPQQAIYRDRVAIELNTERGNKQSIAYRNCSFHSHSNMHGDESFFFETKPVL